MTNTAAGAVLNFPATNGWAQIGGNWDGSVSTGAATFEAWIRTTAPDSQTIVLGSNQPGATPRISVGGDRISVYWNTGGDALGWTSADTTPVTDGQWHHIAVVFDRGAITFYKDGIATADQLTVNSPQQAAGAFQLGAGFGATTGFVGQLYDVRVWSVARTAQQINTARWKLPAGTEAGLTVATSFNASNNSVTNLAGGAVSSPANATVVTAEVPAPTFVLSLGGGDDHIMTPGGQLGNAVTFECWLMMSTAAGVAAARQALMWVWESGKSAACFEYLGGDLLGVSWLGQTHASADTRVISDGTWHHVALVISNGVVTFYKDGVATADTIQLPAGELGLFAGAGAVPGGTGGFNGELHQIRVWGAARTTAQVSAFRYVPLAGPEADLRVLIGFAGSDPADPDTQHLVNLAASNGPVAPQGNPAAVIPAQLPQQPLPANVWTYETAGESPVAPSLSPQGVLCIENTSSDAYLRCVDLETGQASWTYDAAAAEGGNLPTAIIPWAVGLSGQTAYLGVQQKVPVSPSTVTVSEIHAVDVTTGELIGALPTEVTGASQFLTRPVVLNGVLYVGYLNGKTSYTGLAWGAVNDRYTNLDTHYYVQGMADAMTTPVTDGTNVYIATTKGTSSTLSAIPADTAAWGQYAWQKTPPAAVTADPVLGGTTLFVAAGGTILALNTANGATLWSHPLSSSPVKSRPVLLGSTLYAGSTDGVLYALDAATGQEQWRVNTGSAITTDLVNEFGVLYFANAGSGTAAGPAPAFVAVDTASQGNDVLSYPVPGAGTILFDQAGVTSGVAYFYGSQNVWAVNMANVLHEFSVNSKLIVEDYDTTGSAPVGNNTSYRVTLTIRDENGMPRVSQAVKLWSSAPLYVINQGTAVTLTPDQPVWMQTDTSGNLTLALSAFDDGTPDGTPNVACPVLFAWSNFMPAGEAIVVYPDHESLTSLSNVQGTGSSALTAVGGGTPAPLTLQEATGYDGQPLILSDYQNADALNAIAATVRNTIGTRNPATVGARHIQSQRYVKAGVIPNVLHAADTSAAPNRPYVPGADSVFTMDLSGGTPVFTAGTYDPSRPSGYQPTGDTELGGFFSDIGHFASNVVKGAEKVGKMAWKFTENAVTTVIHTVENEYQLVITDLEDAVTVVAGFFKSVVADIKKVIQWLSALFNWENILKNHTYIKQAISNPADSANPGILDRLSAWVNSELNGGSDFSSVLSGLSGQASAAVGSTAQGTAGQTVQSQQGGNNDPNATYNTGGNNNANQCTWMHQKVNENSAGAAVGGGPAAAVGASWDPGPITQAFDEFLTAAHATLKQDFADLPEKIRQALESVVDSFKDPKSLLSTALSGLMTAFQDLADDGVKFAEDLAGEILKLIATLLEQVIIWLTEPVSVPFVSDLYHALTGDQLSVLDLACLLAAVPGTILLAVITGSPTVPDTVSAAPEGALPSGELAGRILLGITAFCVGEVGTGLDIFFLGIESRSGRMDPVTTFLNYLDFAVDFTGYALQMVTSWGWSAWQGQDWAFWIYQSIPQAFNFAYLFRDDGTAELQAARDVLSGVAFLIISSVYADKWPSGYKDAPKAPGLVLSANVLGNASQISELIQLLLGVDYMPVEAVVKAVLYTVSNILGFAANVLGLVDG